MCFEKRVQRYKKEVRHEKQATGEGVNLRLFNTSRSFSAVLCA